MFEMFGRLGEPQKIAYEFFTLAVVGAVLLFLRLKTKKLWLPIGVHCGLVMALKYSKQYGAIKSNSLPWIGGSLREGLIPIFAISIIGSIVFMFCFFFYSARAKTPQIDRPSVV